MFPFHFQMRRTRNESSEFYLFSLFPALPQSLSSLRRRTTRTKRRTMRRMKRSWSCCCLSCRPPSRSRRSYFWPPAPGAEPVGPPATAAFCSTAAWRLIGCRPETSGAANSSYLREERGKSLWRSDSSLVLLWRLSSLVEVKVRRRRMRRSWRRMMKRRSEEEEEEEHLSAAGAPSLSPSAVPPPSAGLSLVL